MSHIDRLNVMGIRSFPVGRGETISLYSPLTLIVGANGSGKTTIVECLKYATTGILPPNTKVGGAFIHDPTLEKDREVMAQVRMQFRNNEGARMVVTRSLQLTVKKNSRSMKTLEGSLMIERHGERTTVSSRAADLDVIMPQYLGTTPAILDNVIFCHQEESLWPLGTPLDLKKKFDEIFQAEKYTKAIENLGKIRKSHMDELGKYKILEEQAKTDRDRARIATRRSVKLSEEIEELREKCNDLQEKMDRAQQLADKLWRESEDYARVLGVLAGKKIEAQTKQTTISDLEVHLKELDDSDDVLERTLDQFSATMANYEEDRTAKKKQWIGWKDSIEALRDQLKHKTADMGKYKHDQEVYEENIKRRQKLVHGAVTRHQLRGFDHLDDEELVEDFLFRIRKLSREQSTALEHARAAQSTEKQDALSLVNKLTARKAALKDKKDTAREQIAQNDREASDYQRKVDAIQADEARKAVLESRIEDIRSNLQRTNERAQTADWDHQIRYANQQLKDHEDKSAGLNRELIETTKRSSEVVRLANLRQDVKEKQLGLQNLLGAHGNRITSLIGQDWSPTTIEHVFQSSLDTAARKIRTAEEVRNKVARELEQIQYQQKTIRDNVESQKAQAEKDKQTVCAAINDGISEYEEALSDVQKKVDYARDESKAIAAMSDYFQKCLEVLDSRQMCRTCSRPFKTQNDPALLQMKKKMEGLIRKTGIDAGEVDLPAAEAEYKRINDAGIAHANWKKLTSEDIPALQKELKQLAQQRESMMTTVESHDQTVQQHLSDRKEIESLSRTVASIARTEGDINTGLAQIEELSAKGSQSGNSKALEDIHDEIDAINDTIRVTKQKIHQLTSDRDASRTKQHDLELQHRDLEISLSDAQSQLDRKATLLARVSEFKILNDKQHEAIRRTDQDIGKLDPEIQTAQTRYDDMDQRWAQQISELSEDVATLSKTVDELNLANDQIQSYFAKGGAGRLATVQREMKSLEDELREADDAQAQLGREINKIDENLRDSDNTKRQYADNLRYRHESRALEILKEEIAELESRDAHNDRERFLTQSREATRQYQNYTGQRQGLLGEMKSKDSQLEGLIKDFETDFKDAPRRWKEAHIKVETTKAAIGDLQIYAKALDNAVIEFHRIKMDEVNSIIIDLWRSTYQGNDIDQIYIASNNDESSSSTRKNYNYRVVMEKRGTQMDMRGRCSAGQKVLASIIIRLALADVFSKDCGLITLDEPTTNLDRDNIVSLAQALHDIIKERRKQPNFQLIVITHDEEFLREMGCGDFADYFYRVSRDGKADSVIERQDIVEVER